MLTIRMQRTGRKGHAMFRIVVQDARRTPTSGKIVALLGSYDPHAKNSSLDKEKAKFFLDHGAQPSERVVRLLSSEGVKLPKWATMPQKQSGNIRNPEKLRKNRPAEAEETKKAPSPEADEQSGAEAVNDEQVEPQEAAPAEEKKETEAEAKAE